MKKLVLFIAIAIIGLAEVQAQKGFKVGANALYTLDVGQVVSRAGFGLDATYLFGISENFDFGLSTGFSQYFGREFSFTENGTTQTVDLGNIQFVPVAVAVRYNFSEKFFLGADVGYALGISERNDGGSYIRPKVGYNLSDKLNLNFGYSRIGNKNAVIDAFQALQLGVEYAF